MLSEASKERSLILVNARIAEAIAQNKSRDLWKELNKLKPHSKTVPPHIDGHTSNATICDNFAENYRTLFNSVPSDQQQMLDIKAWIKSKVGGLEHGAVIDFSHIKEAIKRLKTNKSDGDIGLVSNMVIHAPDSWLKMLAALITSMLNHGYYPEILRKATITSLVKDKTGDVCSSSNYRGIALSSSINKVIDWIILLVNKQTMITSNLQFAFKAHSSTSMCTLALKEVASYYSDKGGSIFCAMLDASKAFDRLRYDKLFTILKKRQLDPLTLRLLLFSYEHQLTRTQWMSELSDYFPSKNGTRQGGVASPILFNLYMDELLQHLEKMQYGCYIGHEYFGVICYADDVTLIAPTVTTLQRMVKTCEQFGQEFDIQYNASKSLCIAVGGRAHHEIPDITLNGTAIPWKSNAKHLGNIINNKNDESEDLKLKKADFIARSNAVIINFKAAPRTARSKVFTSKCCSFHGAQTWKLRSKGVEELHVTWRKAVRRLLHVPRNTRSELLPYLMICQSFPNQLAIRFLKLLKTIQHPDNRKMQWLVVNSSQTGTIRENIAHIANVTNMQRDIVSRGYARLPSMSNEILQQRAGAIFDFMDCKDAISDIILTYLCTF